MKLSEKTMQRTPVIIAFAVIANLLWGSAVTCIKTGYVLLDIASEHIPSLILFAGLRFTLAGILTLILGSLLARRPLLPRKGSFSRIAILALLQTVLQYIFFYIGCANTSGVKAAILGSTNVFICVIISALLYHQEKLSGKKLLGCLLGFGGVVLVNLSNGGLDTNISFLGEGSHILAATSYAFSAVTMKSFSKTDDPVTLSGCQFVLGGLFLIVFGLVLGGRIPSFNLPGLLIIVYLAMISAVAYSLWSLLMKYNPVSRISVYGFMNPVFGVLFSAIFLHESGQAFGFSGIMALGLVCLGIVIVNRAHKN